MDLFSLKQGDMPLIVNVPHAGTYLPAEITAQLNDEGHLLRDTDWHIPRLYHIANKLGASVMAATHSRYVVDLNRPSDGVSLYPGQTTTALCATETFLGDPIYNQACNPDEAAVAERVQSYWLPYHQALDNLIKRTRERHGHVVLWDAHSINNQLPRLFDGRLPDLNFGTFGGQSCSAELTKSLLAAAKKQSAYDFVFDGRFKGGYITRHYGRPDDGVHAVQLELSQATYMDQDPPFAYLESKADAFVPLLEEFLTAALEFRP